MVFGVNRLTLRRHGKEWAILSEGKILAEDRSSRVPPGYLDLVNPELRPLVLPLADHEAMYSPLTLANLPALRRAYLDSFGRLSSSVPGLEHKVISGLPGHPGVHIFVVNADKSKSRPALLHLHGGGFVMGSAEMDLPRLARIAARLDIVVVSVEYRLAPETDWRGSSEDNYAALRWLHTNADVLGVDAARIGLIGESAGGGHAALLSTMARDRREVHLAFQCLVYPMLDDRTGTVRSIAPHLGVVGWSPQANLFGWSSFLGIAAGGADVPVAPVPSRHSHLADLPPTWIGVGDLDLFLEENLAFVDALRGAGVTTASMLVPGAFHGFDEVARLAEYEVGVTTDFENSILQFMTEGFAR